MHTNSTNEYQMQVSSHNMTPTPLDVSAPSKRQVLETSMLRNIPTTDSSTATSCARFDAQEKDEEPHTDLHWHRIGASCTAIHCQGIRTSM